MIERDDTQPKHEAAVFNETRPPYHTGVPEGIYPLRTLEDQGWEEFRDQCRRQMQRPLEMRIRYGFCRRM